MGWGGSEGLCINLQKFQIEHTAVHLFVLWTVGGFRWAFGDFYNTTLLLEILLLYLHWRKEHALVLSLTLAVS